MKPKMTKLYEGNDCRRKAYFKLYLSTINDGS